MQLSNCSILLVTAFFCNSMKRLTLKHSVYFDVVFFACFFDLHIFRCLVPHLLLLREKLDTCWGHSILMLFCPLGDNLSSPIKRTNVLPSTPLKDEPLKMSCASLYNFLSPPVYKFCLFCRTVLPLFPLENLACPLPTGGVSRVAKVGPASGLPPSPR